MSAIYRLQGYGGLPLALFCALELIYGFEFLNNEEKKGVSSQKLLYNPDLHFIYPVINRSNWRAKPHQRIIVKIGLCLLVITRTEDLRTG